VKLLELRLQAFGRFSGVALDFSRDGALHLVYGPNEAGKSTTLRAIAGLLFGIPATTRDAHLHRMPDLRIGARLGDGNGTVIDVVRRKGNKNTLLDAGENAIDEGVLRRLLGGVGEDLFRTMFGLDHESLRAGGEALLRGQGDVGESLFDAGTGGPGVHAVLEDLRREADAIFRPHAQNPLLNQAIAAYRDAERRSRDDGVRADAWFAQRDGLEATRRELDELLQQRPELVAEQARLQRALRVLPLLARRRALAAEREALGEVPVLAADFGERRLAAQREAEQLAPQIERLAAALAALRRRTDELAVPEALAALGDDAASELRDRLGGHRAALADLPKRRAEALALDHEIGALLGDLGEAAARTGEPPRVPVALQARLRSLAKQQSGLENAAANARDALAERSARLASAEARLATLPPAGDAAALALAIERARRAGDVDAQLAAAQRRRETLARVCERRRETVAALLEAARPLPATPLPAAARIDRCAAEDEALAREQSELQARRRELERRAAQSRRAVDELQLLGDIPTETQLAAARQRRDDLWRALRTALARPEEAEEAARAFEPALAAADGLADRLRREAERAGKLAALLAARAEIEEQEGALARERDDWTRRREAQTRAWRELWEAHGVEARSPAEMRAWLAEAEALAQQSDELADAEGEVDRLAGVREALVTELAAALGEGGAATALADLLHRAEARAAARRQAEEERRRLADDVAALRGELAVLAQRASAAEAARERWQAEWRAAATALGLDTATSVEEIETVLDRLGALRARLDERERLRARIAAMERDAERLAHDVQALVAAHAPDLAGLPLEEAAERLLRGQREAREKRQRRVELEGEIDAKAGELAELEERRARALDALALLQRQAGAATLVELEERERRAGEAARLERERQAVDEHLIAAGDGATVDELIALARDVDRDTAAARLRDLEAELERMEERRDGLVREMSRTEAGLASFEGRTAAVDAAAEAQEHAAAIRNHVETYVRARLAAVILEQEIERYRQENQGPILRRANELFPRLTLGAYRTLGVGFDARDEGVLLCVRADGTQVGVEGLSDGTRDQLYLALRLASLERYLQLNPAMPIVLDDILIHFDDQRARAALAILGELAQRAQVLFFTHHARLVELAREAVPSIVEHAL